MGHFDFHNMTLNGMALGECVPVKTVTGLILQCPKKIDLLHVDHMAELARTTPNYPFDLSMWEGPEHARQMIWTARIYWRD